jgi:hypothetical protein
MGSAQLFFLFVLGQYVARIYDEVRDRPLYVVSSTHNFDGQPVRGVSARLDPHHGEDTGDLTENDESENHEYGMGDGEVVKMSNG